MKIEFETLPEPVLEDEFYRTKTYTHTKILLNGDWCLTIKQYVEGPPPIRKSTHVDFGNLLVDDEEDDDESIPTSELLKADVAEPTVTYAVKGHWDMLKYNHGPDKLDTLAAAKLAASAAIVEVFDFLKIKAKLINRDMRFKYRFRYAPHKQATVTVREYRYFEAYRVATNEMKKRGRKIVQWDRREDLKLEWSDDPGVKL